MNNKKNSKNLYNDLKTNKVVKEKFKVFCYDIQKRKSFCDNCLCETRTYSRGMRKIEQNTKKKKKEIQIEKIS